MATRCMPRGWPQVSAGGDPGAEGPRAARRRRPAPRSPTGARPPAAARVRPAAARTATAGCWPRPGSTAAAGTKAVWLQAELVLAGPGPRRQPADDTRRSRRQLLRLEDAGARRRPRPLGRSPPIACGSPDDLGDVLDSFQIVEGRVRGRGRRAQRRLSQFRRRLQDRFHAKLQPRIAAAPGRTAASISSRWQGVAFAPAAG